MDFDERTLRLPEFVSGSTGLTEANPFPDGSPDHQKWAELAALTEQRLLELRARWLAAFPADNATMIAFLCEDFDIWADHATALTVGTDRITSCEAWLTQFAEMRLRDIAVTPVVAGMGRLHADRFLVELNNALSSRVLHWRAKGRRARQDYWSTHQVDASAQESDDQPRSYWPKRAEWLQGKMTDGVVQNGIFERPLTVNRLRSLGGPDATTIKKVLRGERVHPNSLLKLADALDVDVSEIPGD